MGMGKGCQGPWRRPLSAHISGSKGDWSVEKNNSKNIVYSVEKAFRVLHAFTSEAPELLLSDVARRADVDNATAFRMLNTLVQLEYVERVPETKRFRLTFTCLDLGFNAIARMDLRAAARDRKSGV